MIEKMKTLQLKQFNHIELSKQVDNATIVTIACDRGDRYLSTGLFNKNE